MTSDSQQPDATEPMPRGSAPQVQPEPPRWVGSTRPVARDTSVTSNAQEPAAGYLAATPWSQVPPVDPAHEAGAGVPATAASWDQSAAVRPPRRRRWLRGAAAAAAGIALLGAGGAGGYAVGSGSAAAAVEQTADQSGPGELPGSGQMPGDGQLPGGVPGGDGSGVPGLPGSEDGTQEDGTQEAGTGSDTSSTMAPDETSLDV